MFLSCVLVCLKISTLTVASSLSSCDGTYSWLEVEDGKLWVKVPQGFHRRGWCNLGLVTESFIVEEKRIPLKEKYTVESLLRLKAGDAIELASELTDDSVIPRWNKYCVDNFNTVKPPAILPWYAELTCDHTFDPVYFKLHLTGTPFSFPSVIDHYSDGSDHRIIFSRINDTSVEMRCSGGCGECYISETSRKIIIANKTEFDCGLQKHASTTAKVATISPPFQCSACDESSESWVEVDNESLYLKLPYWFQRDGYCKQGSAHRVFTIKEDRWKLDAAYTLEKLMNMRAGDSIELSSDLTSENSLQKWTNFCNGAFSAASETVLGPWYQSEICDHSHNFFLALTGTPFSFPENIKTEISAYMNLLEVIANSKYIHLNCRGACGHCGLKRSQLKLMISNEKEYKCGLCQYVTTSTATSVSTVTTTSSVTTVSTSSTTTTSVSTSTTVTTVSTTITSTPQSTTVTTISTSSTVTSTVTRTSSSTTTITKTSILTSTSNSNKQNMVIKESTVTSPSMFSTSSSLSTTNDESGSDNFLPFIIVLVVVCCVMVIGFVLFRRSKKDIAGIEIRTTFNNAAFDNDASFDTEEYEELSKTALYEYEESLASTSECEKPPAAYEEPVTSYIDPPERNGYDAPIPVTHESIEDGDEDKDDVYV
eukprot:m.313029 g.313029  ORF g.313029 m.313029 type:complete len:653 (+) comp16485_c1_seq4:95-2053(+)